MLEIRLRRRASAKATAESRAPKPPPPGTTTTLSKLLSDALEPSDVGPYGALVQVDGPFDRRRPAKSQPYLRPQKRFAETKWKSHLTDGDLERVMKGTALIMRSPDGRQTDIILRDHNMIDAFVYQYATTGELPKALFHADRHPDYDPRTGPTQYNSWWGQLPEIKRPDGKPLLKTSDVVFVTARPETPRKDDATEPLTMPNPSANTTWEHGLRRALEKGADWVSLDLDLFQPHEQFELLEPMIRDERFAKLMHEAKTRVFVLSPQYTGGGDIVPWTVNGSVSTSGRLINAMRNLGEPAEK